MAATADEAADAVMARAVAGASYRFDREGARVTTSRHQMSPPPPRRVRTAPAGRPPRPAPRCGRPRPRASARWRPGCARCWARGFAMAGARFRPPSRAVPASACGVEPATVDREAEEFRAEAVEPLELGTGWVDGDEDSGDQRHERLQRPQKLGMVYVRRDLIDLQIHAAVDKRIEQLGRASCRERVCRYV